MMGMTTQRDNVSHQQLQRAASSKNAREPAKQLWLDAWADPVAGVKAFSCCIHTCNLSGDGDWRLVIADADKKLKVWKGTAKASEHALLDVPVAVTSFITETAAPRIPTLAVAAGSHVYMFRSLRPYYKFTVPAAGANAAEESVWKQLDTDPSDVGTAAQQLRTLQQQGVQLATRSLRLLAMSDNPARQEFVNHSREQGSSSSMSYITCMDVLKKAIDEPDAVSQLILGTEDKRILILNVEGTAVEKSFSLPAVPAFLATAGELDVGYRITVAARDGRLYNIKSGSLSKSVIQLDSQPVGVVRINKQILVGTMADTLHCYTGKGIKQYSLYMPASIICMHLLATTTSRMTKCVVVALSNGEVRVYNDKSLVSVHTSTSPVSALCAGRYAREDNSLITVTEAGGLDIKILPRTANLEAAAAITAGPPQEQDIPLDVPKKTRLYVEQTQRERQQAVDMHRVFQKDLVKMRLTTARAYVKVLTDGKGSACRAATAELAMSVSIQGLGPRFRLLLNISNEGTQLATDLQVWVQADDAMYKIHNPHIMVPALVPLLQYTYKVDLTCLQPALGADAVRIVVIGRQQISPLMSALVKMPISEVDV